MQTHHQSDDFLIDSHFVISAFERATNWLAAMPTPGYNTRLKVSRLTVLEEDTKVWAHNIPEPRRAPPDAADIEEMDSILGWLTRYIPQHRYVLRRIISARAVTDKHGRPASWARVGEKLGINERAAKQWHAQGIALIVAGLNSE
jgi:hypothetical protein